MRRAALAVLFLFVAHIVQAQTLPVSGGGGSGGSGSGTVSAGASPDLTCYSGTTTVGPCDTAVASYSASTIFVPALQTTGTGASITTTNVTGASTPASGKTAFYSDSTKKRLCGIDDAGSINCPTGIHGLEFEIGSPGGTALTTGYTTVVYKTVPFGCTIAGTAVVIDTGTITVKWLKVAAGTATPAISNSINTTGTFISTGTATRTTTTTDFTTTAVTAYDIMGMYVSAVSGAGYVNGVVQCNS